MEEKFPPLTTAALVPYSTLGPFSEVVPAKAMAELEGKLAFIEKRLNSMMADDNTPHDAYLAVFHLSNDLKNT